MALHDFFKDEDEIPHIDLSSLIDMMFLLLLFFMVTTTFDRNDAIRIQKAAAKSVRPVQEERFKIVLDSAGNLYIGQSPLAMEDVIREVKNWQATHVGGAVLIIPDKRSPMEPFIQLADELKLLGVKNMAIGANPK